MEIEAILNIIKSENYITSLKLLHLDFLENNDPEYIEHFRSLFEEDQIRKLLSPDLLNKYNAFLEEYGYDAPGAPDLSENIGLAEFPAVSLKGEQSTIKSAEVFESKDVALDLSDFGDNYEFRKFLPYLFGEIQKRLKVPGKDKVPVIILNWGEGFRVKKPLWPVGTKYFNPESTIIKGESYHFAAAVALISKLFYIPVPDGLIFTGSFDSKGNSKRVESVPKKIDLIMSERPAVGKIFIPEANYSGEKVTGNPKIIPVKNIYDLIKNTFGRDLEDICTNDIEKLNRIGSARIRIENLGKREIKFENEFTKEERTAVKDVSIWHWGSDDNISYNIFPPKADYDVSEFIVFNGRVPNHYTGYFMHHIFNQSNSMFGIRLGANEKKVTVFSDPRGNHNLVSYSCEIEDLK